MYFTKKTEVTLQVAMHLKHNCQSISSKLAIQRRQDVHFKIVKQPLAVIFQWNVSVIFQHVKVITLVSFSIWISEQIFWKRNIDTKGMVKKWKWLTGQLFSVLFDINFTYYLKFKLKIRKVALLIWQNEINVLYIVENEVKFGKD